MEIHKLVCLKGGINFLASVQSSPTYKMFDSLHGCIPSIVKLDNAIWFSYEPSPTEGVGARQKVTNGPASLMRFFNTWQEYQLYQL